MKKIVKIILWSFLAICSVFLALVLSLYFALRAPSFNQWLFAKMQPQLAQAGIEVTLAELTFDVSRQLSLKNLAIVFKRPGEIEGKVDIAQLVLDYDFSLSGPAFSLDQFLVRGVKVDVQVVGNGEKKPEQPSEPFDLVTFLQKPPVQLTVKGITIEDVEVAVKATLPGQQINFSTPQFKLMLSGLLKSNVLEVDGRIQLADKEANLPAQVSLESQSEVQSDQGPHTVSQKVSLQQLFDTSFKLALKTQEQRLVWQLDPLAVDLETTHLSVETHDAGNDAHMNLRIPSITLNNQMQVSGDSVISGGQMSAASLLPIKMGNVLAVSIPQITMASENKTQEMQLSTQIKVDQKIDLVVKSLTSMQQNNIANFNIAAIVENLRLKSKSKILRNKHTSSAQTPRAVTKGGEGEAETKAKGAQDVFFKSLSVALDAKQEQALKGALALLISGVQLPGVVNGAANLDFKQDFVVDPDFRTVASAGGVDINGSRYLDLDVTLRNLPQQLQVEHRIHAQTRAALDKLVKGLDLTSKLGVWAVSVNGGLRLQHAADSIFTLPIAEAKNAAIAGEAEVQVRQLQLPTNKKLALVEMKKPLAIKSRYESQGESQKADVHITGEGIAAAGQSIGQIQMQAQLDHQPEKLTAGLNGTIGGVLLAAVGKPIKITLNNTLSFLKTSGSLDQHLQISVNDIKALDLKTLLLDAPKNLQLKSDVQLTLEPSLARQLEKLKPLAMVGGLLAKVNLDVGIVHNSAKFSELSEKEKQQLKLTADVAATVTQTQKPAVKAEQQLHLQKPINLRLHASLDHQKLNSKVNVDIAQLEFKPQLKIEQANVEITADSPDIKSAQVLNANVKGSLKQVALLDIKPEAFNPNPLLKDILLELKARVLQKNSLQLDGLTFKVGELLKVIANGNFEIKEQDGIIKGGFALQLPKKLPAPLEGTSSGRILLPWQLVVNGGKKIDLEGKVNFAGFNLEIAKPAIKLKQLQGFLALSEALELTDDKKIRFSYLIAQNPFERVDYALQKPLLGDQQFTLQEAQIGNVSIGPLRSVVSIDQNMFFLHRFDLNLFKGTTTGDLAVNFHPEQLSVRLLSRVTQIQPEMLSTTTGGTDKISMRTAILYDVNKSSMEGRIDITEIGGKQLISLINVLDPKYEDDQLNSARSALNIAYPTYVGIDMNQGLMNMDIELGAGWVSKDISVRKIPLYAFVASATEDLIKKLKEVPLQ